MLFRMALSTGVFENPSVPATLWHYTDAAGLAGILQKREIWASDISFLNDSRERVHFSDLLKRRVSSRFLDPHVWKNSIILLSSLPESRRQYITEHGADALAAFTSDVDVIARTRVCVASFSEERDSLSQWRGYCYAGGFCIGIKGTALKDLRNAEREVAAYSRQIESGRTARDLKKVKYLSEKEHEELDEFIDTMIVLDALFYGTSTEDNETSHDVISQFVQVKAPLVKDHHFASEIEWRLIVQADTNMTEGLNFRSGRSCLVPYLKLPLAGDFIDEIIVGPGRNADLDVRALEALKISAEMSFEVSKSAIPYRNW
jgi:hypothetical protein